MLVLGAVLGLYLWPRSGDPRHDFGSDVRECQGKLGDIYAALMEYKALSQTWPRGSGVAFLAELIASGRLEDSPGDPALACPGRHAQPVPEGTDYAASATLTPLSSSYAARNSAEFPLAKFPSGGAEREPLVACDNAQGMNHDGVMNVLYSDGSVMTIVLEQELERGTLPAGSTTIEVGPSSPVPDLRKLTGDR